MPPVSFSDPSLASRERFSYMATEEKGRGQSSSSSARCPRCCSASRVAKLFAQQRPQTLLPGACRGQHLRPGARLHRCAVLQERPRLSDHGPGRLAGGCAAPGRAGPGASVVSEQDGGAEGEPAPELSLASRTVRNTAMVAGSRFLSRLLVVYVFLLIARSVTTDNYGRFSLLVVLSSIVSVIVDIALRPLFIPEAAKDHRVLSPYLNSILSLKLVMTLPAFLVLFGAMRLLLPEDIGHALLPTLLL